ncbi:O-antigen/teichoic acid export membrane protein [Micrococcus cohnii]|uniref:O-antigen/teichoic acid export membrane protein n=1 Tax=Micrococcus cohnii TaxID=993416 RepID=A0A7W7M3H9_9MICC|nr:hypothetical protein [Micrococcus cohnii]MBB4735676.1 O-antigen/teichoic acid export membrane protein [Micrococcus cohnii]
MGFAAYLLIVGLTRAMVSEPVAADLPGQAVLRHAGQPVALWGTALGSISLLVGLLVGNPFLVCVGLAAHGLSLGEFSKFAATAFGRPTLAIGQEGLRLALFLAGFAVPAVRQDPVLLFVVWSAGAVLAGYVFTAIQGIYFLPRLRRDIVPAPVAMSYGADHLLGAGTTQLSTFGLGAWAAPGANAAIRGSGTMLGPVTTFVVSGRSLVIPYLSRGRKEQQGLKPAVHLIAAMALLALPLLVLINFIPDPWGRMLLGETWPLTAMVLPVLSAEALISLTSTVAFAGHRSMGAHRRTLLIRLVMSPVRLGLIVGGGILWGPFGAAWGTLIASALTFAVWWTSYVQLARRGA